MEALPSATSFMAAALAVTVLAFLWKAVVVLLLTPWRLERSLRGEGLNGSPYRLMVGDLLEMNRLKKEAQSDPMPEFSNNIVSRLLPFFQKSVEKYGNCCFRWVGPAPVLVVTDGILVREVLKRVYEFEKPDMKVNRNVLVSGLVLLEGHKWAKHRKILSPAFHLNKLKSVLAASIVSCAELIHKWETLISPEISCEVNVLTDLEILTGDITARAAIGSSYEEGKAIFRLQSEQVANVFKTLHLAFIPGYSFLPTKINRRMKQVDRQVRHLLKGVVDGRLKYLKNRGDGTEAAENLLDVLLESNSREMEEMGHEKGMNMKEVMDECKGIYLAGQETTAGLLIWTLILLSKHLDWQSKAREEILQVFGEDKEINFNGLFQLKTMNMILNEVLRLYPPTTLIYRKVNKATKLGPYYLPAGVHIQVPILLIHHDRQLWGEDAQVFNPNRFSNGVSNAGTGKSPLPFLPFSSGVRVCIGRDFSSIESKAVLAMILRRFTVELSPSYRHSPSAMLSIRPQHGAPLILRKLPG
ncbi:hypothetical protein SAY86_028993 [Trapa natans]|uniref:Uncharacterized protein n=1 Tax=Trapa natans TaxID=22666 RepID=A0AAN7RBA4_TRANT|nr:hypothetical protein SAY86_028993 [Trapa natans]